MEYKKIEKDFYNIHFIKTNNFKKTKIKINFKEEISKKNISYRNMLALILFEATNNFPSRRLIDIECENLYNLGVHSETTLSGNYQLLKFEATFLNEKYTEKGNTKKSIDFLFDCIFNPYLINESFEKQSFINAKSILKADIESYNDNPTRYAYTRLYENMCPDSPLGFKSSGYLEDLNKITPKNLYKYYLKLLNNNAIDIFVVGDFDINEIDLLIENKLQKGNNKRKRKKHFINQDEFKLIPNIIKEQKDISQSILLLASKINKLSKFEMQYVLTIYNYILGGGPDSLLFNEVREKNSLCYGISSSTSAIGSLMYIKAGINSDNFDKAFSIIKEQIKRISDGDFDKKVVNKAINLYLSSLEEIEDSQSAMINSFEAHEYLKYDEPLDKAKNIVKVTKKDIINLSKKINLDTLFFLEGVQNDKE